MIAYPEEAVDRAISTKAVISLAKEFNLGLMGAKWRNNFLSAQEVRELKGEATYRGEVLSLFMNMQTSVLQALDVHHERTTGPKEEGASTEGEEGAAAGKEEVSEKKA